MKKMMRKKMHMFNFFWFILSLFFLIKAAFSKEIQDHDLNIGMKFKGELRQTDHGLEKTPGNHPEDSLGFFVHSDLILDGKINDFVDFSSSTELLSSNKRCMNSALKWAWARVAINDFISLSTGCHEINQGGWDAATKSLLNLHPNQKVEGPFAEYAPSFEYVFKLGGELAVQLLNDVNTSEEGNWNHDESVTFNVDWRGDFAGFEPLIQVGSYDNNKSIFTNIGLKSHWNHLSFRLDILNNSIADRVLKPGSSSDFESKIDQAMSVIYYADYTVSGVIIPYIYAAFYDKKQHTTDLKYNSRNIADESLNWDDNSSLVSLGAKFPIFGENFWAYLAYDQISGKYQKASTETEVETLTESTLKLGTMGVL